MDDTLLDDGPMPLTAYVEHFELKLFTTIQFSQCSHPLHYRYNAIVHSTIPGRTICRTSSRVTLGDSPAAQE